MTTLTTEQLAQLSVMRAQAQADAAAGIKSYYKIYAQIADWLEAAGTPLTDTALRWLRGATQANKGEGAIKIANDTQWKGAA
ncbi:hypothetical protein KIK84_13710 [Curvibacter sp. CHRR-16]|uniref:hypothetical protein n=1 Tax=Curvibacter sp. CHRR-16 TaxID=2835872 RepID=UPI001BDA822F|nr:hypothetical protein [Curvibacter sp. CHRR-16]MBT0571386.1 hypothetical protein [Curvibacter sp. CHRR-16]